MPTLPGHRAFRTFLRQSGRGAAARIAEAMDVTPQAVSGWKKGKTVPEPHLRPLLETATGGAVPAALWRTAEEAEAAARDVALRAAQSTRGEAA